MIFDAEQDHLDGYHAHVVPGMRARKIYQCPGCGNPIPVGAGHVVAWPDDQVEERRHWHTHCWRAACRRGRIA
ncbi:MAG: hypothetical protein WD377_09075 [Nitriliruptoraceae bacterium]